MIKAEILEALPKLSQEERREIRAKLNGLDAEEWFDDGELTKEGGFMSELEALDRGYAPTGETGQ